MKNPHGRTNLTHLLVAGLAFGWFALSFKAQAVSPPPDGGYPNQNTAEGDSALLNLTTGTDNTAVGFNALVNNTTGSYNTANGSQALLGNTTGGNNTAYGFWAMLSNTTGTHNTAIGGAALYYNTTGGLNTAIGGGTLSNCTTGSSNTGVGNAALLWNTTGTSNTAIGSGAGLNITTGNFNIDIGNNGHSGDDRTIRIGTHQQDTTYIAGISGKTVPGGVGVIVDMNGRLGTVVSSARYKDAIRPMDKASEAILSLNPVTFRYKKELDPIGIAQFGLVAEQVEKVDPDLVARDDQGKPYTVRYEAVNAMLLNEFLKEHRKVEAQEATITQVKSTVAKQEAMIAQQEQEIQALSASLKAQAAQIQKVSDQLRARAPAPRVVAND